MKPDRAITLELVTIDENTGAVLPCSQLPVSAPTPEIILTTAVLTLDGGQRWSPGKWTGELMVEGKVTSGVACQAPGSKGVIKEIYLDHAYDMPLAKIPVRVTKYESDSPTQPFFFEGTFTHRMRLDFLDTRYNHFRLVAHDPVFGRNGDVQFVFLIEADAALPEEENDEEIMASECPLVKFYCSRTNYNVASQQTHFHLLLCRVHPDAGLTQVGEMKIPTLAGMRDVVRGPGNFLFLADVTGTRPEVLLAIAEDAEPPLAPGFPPEMHPSRIPAHQRTAKLDLSVPSDAPKPFRFVSNDSVTRRRFIIGFKRVLRKIL